MKTVRWMFVLVAAVLLAGCGRQVREEKVPVPEQANDELPMPPMK